MQGSQIAMLSIRHVSPFAVPSTIDNSSLSIQPEVLIACVRRRFADLARRQDRFVQRAMLSVQSKVLKIN